MPWENRRFDFILVTLVSITMIFGLITLYSTTLDYGVSFVKRQISWDVIGFGTFFAVTIMRERDVKRLSWPLYIVVVLLLILVLFFGTVSGGARRWFSLRVGYFQPSELAKVALILLSANLLANFSRRKLLILGSLVGLLAILVAIEPDLGTAVLLVSLWFAMVIFSKCPARFLLAIALVVAFSAIFLYFFGLKEYQRERLISFLDPASHRQSAAYNVMQSVHAIGSGGIIGRGYLRAPATRWNYVPKSHTDFVFSAIGEQFGFIGSALCIFLYLLMCMRILQMVRLAKDEYWSLICLGVLFNLVTQVFVNIGMTMGLVPVTGIPLPFISYGGSSTLSFCIQLGLVEKSYAIGKSGVQLEVK